MAKGLLEVATESQEMAAFLRGASLSGFRVWTDVLHCHCHLLTQELVCPISEHHQMYFERDNVENSVLPPPTSAC